MADSENDGRLYETIAVGPCEVEKSQAVVEVSDADLSEMLGILRETIRDHELDPNFRTEILTSARTALRETPDKLETTRLQGLVAEIQAERDLLLNDSPYAEVRAVVDNTDDPSTPVNTFRAWFLGIIFTILGTGMDQFFSLRYPGIYLYTVVAQLVGYPCRVFLARVLPTTTTYLHYLWEKLQLKSGSFQSEGAHAHHYHVQCRLWRPQWNRLRDLHFPSFEAGHILWNEGTGQQCRIPNSVDPIYPIDWLWMCWYHTSVFGLPSRHVVAPEPRPDFPQPSPAQ